jgi:DNA-binding beta-propeller fold protein YncE
VEDIFLPQGSVLNETDTTVCDSRRRGGHHHGRAAGRKRYPRRDGQCRRHLPARTDVNALVIGPTGVGLGPNGTLYVADTLTNRIAAIPGAAARLTDDGSGRTVSKDGALNGELGLAIAPNGDILTANGGDGNIVETTPGGAQVAVKTIDQGGAGDLFGLAVKPGADAVYFVDDAGTDNNLQLFH